MKLKTILTICFIVAIEILFCFTPLGTILIGPIAATLSMVPVIIAGLLFGERAGMIIGLVFAICSFIYWTFIMPAFPTAFLFTPFSEAASYKGNVGSLIICFVPRILAGLTPVIVSKAYMKVDRKNAISGDILGSIAGSLTNTVLVLAFIGIFFGKEYSTIIEKGMLTLLGATIVINGIPEAIVCAIICPLVVRILRKI